MSSKALGLKELIAIAIGGMVGGGIFSILGISVAMSGYLAPFAIATGGIIAFLAAYSYVKLALFYKDEGAMYEFFRKTFKTDLSASFIGWFILFGYVSTLALYAYTFSSYAISGFAFANNELIRKGVAIAILAIFALVNIWSVKGMGRLEDFMVYIKLVILLLISFALIYFTKTDFHSFILHLKQDFQNTPLLNILIVASVTFVAYEGFELVINAINETQNPARNIPMAIYISVIIVSLLYFIIAFGSVLSIPVEDMIKYKEYALAKGAGVIFGNMGRNLVIVGAVLATWSAINGTLFGASRQMARVADDGYLPKALSKRRAGTIPYNSIILIAVLASLLILSGGLRVILEFGSITFLFVSLLMAIANFKIRKETNSSTALTLFSIISLSIGAVLILYNEYKTEYKQLIFIVAIYIALTIGAYVYAKIEEKRAKVA